MNYTKGEWKVEDRESDCTEYLGIEDLSRETFPLIVNMPTQFSILGRCGAIVSAGTISYTEAVANAHLIAAAPEMYEALKDIAEMKVMPVSYIEVAKSIVAKAKGGK